jgi:hypothetical protein
VRWLGAEEFMRMSMALPVVDSTGARSDQLRDIENTFRGGPTIWFDRFPGPEIVRRAREWAAVGSSGTGG